jgi:hypothetical protein
MTLRRFCSAPVLIVAVLAFALGSVGTAVAGPALTKGKVKAIAGKVVRKAAPTLSVGHATSATTASSLDGQPPSAYLDRVVQASSTTAAAVPAGDTNQVLGPLSITVPAGVGFVHVNAAASFRDGDTPVGLWFQTDGACLDAGNDFGHRQKSDTFRQTSVSLNRVVPVTAGVHTFRLCVITSEAIFVDSRELTVETVALGG